MSSELTLDRRDGVAVMTLRAPERRNALSVEMADAMVDACEQIDADPAIGAVVVTGEGPFFCAGGDRAQLAAAGKDPAEPELYRAMSRIYNAFARVGALEPPTVAAICGGAIGAGLNLALATDLRVVAEDAKLLSGFLPIGTHPGGGHSALLSRARWAGRPRTRCSCLASPSPGCEAVDLGLAWAAVPPAPSRRPRSTSPACRPPTPSWHAAPLDRCARSPVRRRSHGRPRSTSNAHHRCGPCGAGNSRHER